MSKIVNENLFVPALTISLDIRVILFAPGSIPEDLYSPILRIGDSKSIVKKSKN
jgi:hypothetical protein